MKTLIIDVDSDSSLNLMMELAKKLRFKARVLSEDETKIRRFTKKELQQRAKKANSDIAAGRVKSQAQLEKESENW